jgi:menaquinone-specific isochorismate synthase
MTALAHTTRLVATTRPVALTRPLLDELGDDGFAWLHDGAGMVTAGVVAVLDASEVTAFLSGIARDDAVRVRGTGPIAFGALPFRPDATHRHVVPARVLRRAADGTTWLTELSGARGGGPARADDATASPRPGRYVVSSVQSHAQWCTNVCAALHAIECGELEKVVLAREVVIEADHPFPRRDVLHRLVASQPGCFVHAAGALVGASPELLVARAGRTVTSRPLAGTAPRAVDDSTLASSGKDRHEHAVVADAVVDTLAASCDDVRVSEPELVRFADVTHLATTVQGRLRDPAPSALDLARRLSPTPAVAGTPRDGALAFIDAIEGFDRVCYAGPVGWVDAEGDGEWAVALRGATLERRRARLVAGAGIVAGSDPDAEWAETEAKLAPMLRVLVTP